MRAACCVWLACVARAAFWPISEVLVQRRGSKRAPRSQELLFLLNQLRGVAGHGVDFEVDVVACLEASSVVTLSVWG